MRCSLVLFICIASFLAAPSMGADDPPADFKVDAVAWTKEHSDDPKAFAKKYQDKIVEVTGKLFVAGDIGDDALRSRPGLRSGKKKKRTQ